MHEFGWNFSTRIFVMQQIDQYRESLKFQDGWLDNVDQDLVKLDDTWLKLAQMMYGQITEKRDQNKRLQFLIVKEGVDKAEQAKSWLKMALEHGAQRKAIFLIAGTIVAKFFPQLDHEIFLFFREQDIRLAGNSMTIVENLDPIQFLMPFDQASEPAAKGILAMDKPQFLEALNEVLNVASEQLRTYSGMVGDPEFFEDIDDDLIQVLYIFVIEDLLKVKYSCDLN